MQLCLEPVFTLGLTAIVLGGGNNNSLPVLRAVRAATSRPTAAVNCDPHADFRRAEGRHSGNPFRYAKQEGALERYAVFGLHEGYDSEDMLEEMESYHFMFASYESMFVRKSHTIDNQVQVNQ